MVLSKQKGIRPFRGRCYTRQEVPRWPTRIVHIVAKCSARVKDVWSIAADRNRQTSSSDAPDSVAWEQTTVRPCLWSVAPCQEESLQTELRSLGGRFSAIRSFATAGAADRRWCAFDSRPAGPRSAHATSSWTSWSQENATPDASVSPPSFLLDFREGLVV